MSVRNFAEGEVDSAATPPTVEPLGEGNETHQTITQSPKAPPEPPQATDETKPVLISSTHDDQDTVSVRGAWVQGVLNACGPLGMGPGDGSPATDGGQDLMTPGTATAMSMMSLGSLSTPTVTGGGCPSDEPSEPQCNEHEKTDRNNQTIVPCSINGDLLLHIRYQSDQDATTEISAPILSLRVSSEILRIASDPLELLLNGAELHHLIAIRKPRVWGCRERKGTLALILKTPIQSEQLRQAALIVFNIIHPNKYRPTEAPTMLQIAWVAELAWVLDCLDPITPWIKSWVAGCTMVDADTRLVSALLLGFVMGDSETFEQASLHWLLRGTKCDFDKFEGSSLGVLVDIQDALQEKREEAAQGLIDILNESLHSYCGNGNQAGNFDQTFVLGAFFSAVCNSSTGVTMIPLYSSPGTGPPFQLQWQPQMNEESINFLLGKVVAITGKFSAQLQLHRQPRSPGWENPVPPLAAKVVRLRESLRGLTLTKFRQGVEEVMNTRACLGNVAGEMEEGLLRLKRYSVYVPPPVPPGNKREGLLQPGKVSRPGGNKRKEWLQAIVDKPMVCALFIFFALMLIISAGKCNQR